MGIQITLDDGTQIKFQDDIDGWFMTINEMVMLECLSRKEVNDIALAGLIPVFKDIERTYGREVLKGSGCSGILEYV